MTFIILDHGLLLKSINLLITLKMHIMLDTAIIHPILVHFPIALVIIGFLSDTVFLFFRKEVCLSKTGMYLLYAGTLAAIVTWLSGFLFTSAMSGPAGEIKETHEMFATITVCILIIASVIRLVLSVRKAEASRFKWIVFALYCLAAVSVGITGFYGGDLVYNYLMPL
jgi:uncharacterized membrane protein